MWQKSNILKTGLCLSVSLTIRLLTQWEVSKKSPAWASWRAFLHQRDFTHFQQFVRLPLIMGLIVCKSTSGAVLLKCVYPWTYIKTQSNSRPSRWSLGYSIDLFASCPTMAIIISFLCFANLIELLIFSLRTGQRDTD